jgi:hypothetical protein
VNPESSIRQIATLLEGQGDREMGSGVIHWSTRVGEANGCILQLQVHTTMKLRDTWEKQETIRFPIGALDKFSITADARSLSIECRDREKCVQYATRCQRTGDNGTMIDCSESHRQNLAYLYINAGQDNGVSLMNSFEKAIAQCRAPQLAGF